MSQIHVTLCSSALSITEHWDDLVRRAPANVFMDPAALDAVRATAFARLQVLLAWDRSTTPETLVGLWALQEKSIAALGPAVLSAPPYDYAFLSNPVVDRAHMDAVVAAMLDAIEREPGLPKVLRLRYLDGDCATYAALLRALTARGGPLLKLADRPRPAVTREAGRKSSGSTRKKLRQDWNRLGALGAVEVVNDRAPEQVRDAFEVFLAMEAGSWKGGTGTALLSKPEDAAFARRLASGLAAHGHASVALLRVAGEPIAAQVLLYCGPMAYTWKTAFNAEYGRYSPGALLIDKITDDLFATEQIEAIESCSPDGSFMGQLWTGRRSTVDLLASVGPRISIGYPMALMTARGHAQLRRLRDKFREVSASSALAKKARLAAAWLGLPFL
jgi:CelD/BcsL family acetyltransferase involved in cellulose biosynthesis